MEQLIDPITYRTMCAMLNAKSATGNNWETVAWHLGLSWIQSIRVQE